MKKISLVILAAVIVLFACKPKTKKMSNDIDSDIKSYVENNPGLNAGKGTFSIQAAQGWTKVDTTISGLQIVLLKSEVEGPNDIFMENINVVTEQTKGMDLDEYFKANLASLNNGMPGYEKISSDVVTVNGREARHLIYTHTYTGNPTDVEAYFFTTKDMGYVITCSADKGKLAKWKPDFDKVVNTFTIN
jgi:hypothetical protein